MKAIFPLLVLALATAEAAAAQCLPPDPPVGGAELAPLGCAVTVYVSPQSPAFDPAVAPSIQANRGGQTVDVTGQVETTTTNVDMVVISHDGNCDEVHQPVPVSYFVYTFVLAGAVAGDQLSFAGAPVGTVVDAGACNTPEPPTLPTCDARNPTCDDLDDPIDPNDTFADDEASGCNATGSSAGLLALLALLGCRRRR